MRNAVPVWMFEVQIFIYEVEDGWSQLTKTPAGRVGGSRTSPSVVVVYQCSISNVMYTGYIEALFVLVHAVLDC